MLPVILSGGSGTRLWPLSRRDFPKQFQPLLSKKTLFQETIERVYQAAKQDPLIVCNEEHRFIVAEQMREQNIKPKAIILEPIGRNTAPAIAVASFSVIDSDPILLVCPSDHYIPNTEVFSQTMEEGKHFAKKGKFVCFGITPTTPRTGFGYILASEDVKHPKGHTIKKFIEKPCFEDAKEFLTAGSYFWNSGIFLFKASHFLKLLQQLQPEIYSIAKTAYEKGVADLDFFRLEKSFCTCPSNSIDYAIMEKIQDGVMIPFPEKWSDVGSWSSIWETQEKDPEGNVKLGDVVSHATKNSYLRSEKLLVTIGVEDLIIVETEDSILVVNKSAQQSIKETLDKLKEKGRPEVENHRKVYRPWGFYDRLAIGERHQVKRIVVKPGGTLSLQYHHHRSEHWVVVKGTAKVTQGEKVFLLSENQSTYISLGEIHRIENPGKCPLELIEVQVGSYLEEDDIIRLEDVYSRAPLETTAIPAVT